MRKGTLLLFCVFILLVGLSTAAAAQSKCAALKYKFAGKAAFLTAKCSSKAAKKGEAIDVDCLAKAAAFLSKKWATAEAKGDCFGTGDQAAIQADIDAFISALTADLEPVCGNDVQEGGEVCDGVDDAACPGGCLSDCSCCSSCSEIAIELTGTPCASSQGLVDAANQCVSQQPGIVCDPLDTFECLAAISVPCSCGEPACAISFPAECGAVGVCFAELIACADD